MPIATKIVAAVMVQAVSVVAGAAAVFAQSVNEGGDLPIVVSGTALTAAVGALVYVVRSMIQGKLVPKVVDEQERERTALLKSAEETNRRMAEMLQNALAREQRYEQIILGQRPYGYGGQDD